MKTISWLTSWKHRLQDQSLFLFSPPHKRPGEAVKCKTVSMCDFKTPSKWGFLSCQIDTLNKDFSMLSSQNLTPKRGFAQKFTLKSDRVLEKVPDFLKMAVFDTLNAICEFPFQSRKNNNNNNNPYSPFSLPRMLAVLNLTTPPCERQNTIHESDERLLYLGPLLTALYCYIQFNSIFISFIHITSAWDIWFL